MPIKKYIPNQYKANYIAIGTKILLMTLMSLFIVLLLSARTYAAEPKSLADYKNSILKGKCGVMPMDELMGMFMLQEGPPLRDAYIALALRKQEALPVVLQKLKSSTALQKRKIIKFLKYSNWSETAPNLIEIASSQDEHELSRIGALYALGALGKKSDGKKIAGFLNDNYRGLTEKRVLFSTLAHLGYVEAVPEIREYMGYDDLLTKIFTARSLAELGEKIDVSFLMDALSSEDYVIRQEACGALGSIGGSNTIRALEEVRGNDPHNSVRRAARIALIRITMSEMSTEDKSVFLENLLSDEDGKIRKWAIDALATQCGQEGLTVLWTAVESNTSEQSEILDRLLIMSGQLNMGD